MFFYPTKKICGKLILSPERLTKMMPRAKAAATVHVTKVNAYAVYGRFKHNSAIDMFYHEDLHSEKALRKLIKEYLIDCV